MKIESALRAKLGSEFDIVELSNESPGHGLPASAEKHFRVVLTSPKFAGLSRVERHRLVHDLVAEELRTHVHALSVHAFTPEEWIARQQPVTGSPACLGGSKHERK